MIEPNIKSACHGAPTHVARINDRVFNICDECYEPCIAECEHVNTSTVDDGDGVRTWWEVLCRDCGESLDGGNHIGSYYND